MASGFAWTLAATVSASLASASVTTPLPVEPKVSHTRGHATKKALLPEHGTPAVSAVASFGPPTDQGELLDGAGEPLLGTLFDVHAREAVPLDALLPSQDRFDRMLADRVTGASQTLDPRLIGLLRSLARAHPGARIELVSGFRSPKLNEMLRKKGHHVASHSQHSLGHAVDFRLIEAGPSIGPPRPDDAKAPMDPLAVEQEVRRLGWVGGVGVYLGKDDRFVHADVGPNRRWNGL